MAIISSKCFRYPLVFFVCVMEFIWIGAGCLLNTKCKKFFWIMLLICVMIVLWLKTHFLSLHMKGQYTRWISQPQFHRERTVTHFVQGANDDIFMYSAIVNDGISYGNDLTVVITSLDKTYNTFKCCFIMDNETLYTTPAYEYFSHFSNRNEYWAKYTKHYDPGRYRAHQHWCFLPNTGHFTSHVMLTSSQCSSDITDYVSITYIPPSIGKIALCAKIAHSDGIDPEKFIEWVEIQRIQGVDKIQIYDLGNSPSLFRVFRYYQDLGILQILPYELPGLPKDRSLQEKYKRTLQFTHDETLSVLDCRQRMGGYTYVLSHDVDEFLIPREDVDLKTFLKKKMETNLDAAGFMFFTEFFIYNWGPSHPKEDLMVTRFRESTPPRWECMKYVFLPSRVHATQTHEIHPHKPFKVYDVPQVQAILHHYRQCPSDVWLTCRPPTINDHTMTRFTVKYHLHQRVQEVRKATNIAPTWKT